jgi:four helix bundle protein
MKSYKDLDIYNISSDLAIETHHQSLKLPQFELYETGSQVRRSSKSVPTNITEGYGRSRYKQEFIKFLVYAHASCDETIHHLTIIKKLYEHMNTDDLLNRYDELGRKINSFIQYVEKNWNDTSKFNS